MFLTRLIRAINITLVCYWTANNHHNHHNHPFCLKSWSNGIFTNLRNPMFFQRSRVPLSQVGLFGMVIHHGESKHTGSMNPYQQIDDYSLRTGQFKFWPCQFNLSWLYHAMAIYHLPLNPSRWTCPHLNTGCGTATTSAWTDLGPQTAWPQQDTRVPVSKCDQGLFLCVWCCLIKISLKIRGTCSWGLPWSLAIQVWRYSPVRLNWIGAAPQNFMGENLILPMFNKHQQTTFLRDPSYLWTHIRFGEISDCTGIYGHPHGMVEMAPGAGELDHQGIPTQAAAAGKTSRLSNASRAKKNCDS